MTKQLSISLRGFSDDKLAQTIGNTILSYFNQLNEYTNLNRLELISVGYSEEDYKYLLNEFREGLINTDSSVAVGAGMTVISNPKNITFRIFFSGIGIGGLIKKYYENDDIFLGNSIHTIIHEFMHVHAGTELYTNYPDFLSTMVPKNLHQELKYKTILSCWTEYRVCSLCAGFGENPLENYKTILKDTLNNFEKKIENAKFTSYEWGELLIKIYSEIHDLLKYTSYYIGTCIGLNINYTETEFYQNIVTNSWFCEYFDELAIVLDDINSSFKTQSYNLDQFSNISAILVNIAIRYKILAQEKDDNVWVEFIR